MPSLSTYAIFVVDCLALLAIPGPAVLYVVSRSIDQGRRAGSRLGARDHDRHRRPRHARDRRALVAHARVTRRLRRRPLRRRRVSHLPRRPAAADAPASRRESRSARRERARDLYTQGLIVNLLNPKTIVFIFAFIPQFVDVGAGHVWLQIMLLGLTFAGARLRERQPLRLRRGHRRRPAPRHAAHRPGRALVRRDGADRARGRLGARRAAPLELNNLDLQVVRAPG